MFCIGGLVEELVMKVPREHDARIRRIISGMKCPHQLECCHPDVRGPAHIHCRGSSNLTECLDKHGRRCPFGVPFGYSIFCRCPLCKYLVEHNLYRPRD